MSLTAWFARWWANYWDRKLGRTEDTHASEMAEIRETLAVAKKRCEAMAARGTPHEQHGGC